MNLYQLEDNFAIESLRLTQQPDPLPGGGQVLLKMSAWSLNYRDLLVVKGLYNPKIPLPMIPLSDGVGEVIAVGDGVTRVQVGDRVAGCFMPGWIDGEVTPAKAKTSLGGGGIGMLAEQVVLDANGVTRVPNHLSDEEAATLPCAALTAWHALVTEGHIKAGDTVLILGTGGVSLFALQFARLHGARVIATSSSDAKLKRVKELGASDGVNYKSNPDWDKAVKELTGGEGVDHVIEVGGAGTMERSLRAVRMGGTISLIGILAQGDFDLRAVLMKKVRVQGIYVGARSMFEAMNRAIDMAKLRLVIDRVFPFEAVPDAFRHLESGQHFGKICVKR